jgi:threonine/homoserine/homoserine lactone efflux protein
MAALYSGAGGDAQLPLNLGIPSLQFDPSVLGAFALLWLAIVPTPGPNTLLILHLALTAPWRDVAVALAGNLLAVAFYALATLLGLSLLLAAAPSLRLGIYLLGGAYLLWTGLRLVRAGLARGKEDLEAGLPGGPAHGGGPFAKGALTALANVPALFFLTSIFASVGVLSATRATKAAAVAIIIIANGAYLSGLAWLLQRPGPRAVYARYRPLMEIGFGALFMAFGARLVARELAAWL